MKHSHTINSARSSDLRFSLQALMAVGVVVTFVFLLHLT